MSDITYFANTFYELGNLTIDLDNALNLLVRSYRAEVSGRELKAAKENLLSFLAIVLGVEEKDQSFWRQQLKDAIKASIEKKGGLPKLESIRRGLESNTKLSQPDIGLLDTLISQTSQQATMAYLKLRSSI